MVAQVSRSAGVASGRLPGEVARTQGGSLDENGHRRRRRRSGYQERQCKDPELSQHLLQPCLGGHVSGHVSGHSYGHLLLAGTILDRADLEWPAVHTGRPRAGPEEGRGAWRWADQRGEVSEGPWVSAAGSVPASSPGLCASPLMSSCHLALPLTACPARLGRATGWAAPWGPTPSLSSAPGTTR